MRPIEPFFATLAAANPHPADRTRSYSSVFELLAAVLLSAQATDVSVNKATRRCSRAGADAAEDGGARGERVTELVRTIGLFRTKAQSGRKPAGLLVEQHGGCACPREALRGAARRRPQDRQRGAQRRLRRTDDGGGHAHLPRRQPHGLAPGATRWRSSQAC